MHSKAREKLAASPASDALANNDIIERIRAIEHFSDLKILCISGVADQSAVDALIAAGADMFLPKPFDVRTLRAATEQVLTRQFNS
jgi:DNA-binding response OmpR family regulator